MCTHHSDVAQACQCKCEYAPSAAACYQKLSRCSVIFTHNISAFKTVSSGQAVYVEGVLTQLLIEVTLLLSHVSIQDQLLLAWQAVFHITLDAPQQEGLEDGVQLCDDLHTCTNM